MTSEIPHPVYLSALVIWTLLLRSTLLTKPSFLKLYPRDSVFFFCFSHPTLMLPSYASPWNIFLSLLILVIFDFFFFFFSGPHPQNIEIPRLGVELELQLLAYTAATATPDPSHICNLHHSSLHRWILNPLSGARD